MLAYIARRLALAIGTVFAAVLLTFLLVHATGGSPGAIRLGPGATAEEIAAENAELGWDRPLYVQFFDYLGSLVQGDLGTSLIDGRDIASDLADRLPVTSSIALLATIFSGIIGVLVGVTAAVRGGRFGKFITSSSGIALSLPAFWVGVLLVYFLSLQLQLLPATGYVPFTTNPVAWFDSILIPVLTLTVGGAAIIARTAAVGMREAFKQEHIRTLRAMGTPEWRIRYVHALRFASVPVVSVLGIQFIALFGGSVIIENLFALPGLGQASQAAAVSSDYPALIGVVIIATLVVVIINLLLDLVIAWLDPKVRTA
jgi:peptide/nickel transport system permease protein